MQENLPPVDKYITNEAVKARKFILHRSPRQKKLSTHNVPSKKLAHDTRGHKFFEPGRKLSKILFPPRVFLINEIVPLKNCASLSSPRPKILGFAFNQQRRGRTAHKNKADIIVSQAGAKWSSGWSIRRLTLGSSSPQTTPINHPSLSGPLTTLLDRTRSTFFRSTLERHTTLCLPWKKPRSTKSF